MDKRLRELQSRLNQYWKTTYADKLREEQRQKEQEEAAEDAERQRQKRLQELSIKIEAYQEKTAMNKPNKKKSKRDKEIEHHRRCGAFLLDIRTTVRLMNEIGEKDGLGRKERMEYDELRVKLKDLLAKLRVEDEDTWKVANKYVEGNLNIVSIW